MNCLQAEEYFSAHFEDTLDYQTLQDFEGHLAECEACQQEYSRFQESVKMTQQLPQIEHHQTHPCLLYTSDAADE